MPGSVPALYNLLLTQNEQHKTSSALATASALLKIAPRNTPAHLMKAALLQQEHDLIGASCRDSGRLEIRTAQRLPALYQSGLLYSLSGAVPMRPSRPTTPASPSRPDDFGAQFNLGLLYSNDCETILPR